MTFGKGSGGKLTMPSSSVTAARRAYLPNLGASRSANRAASSRSAMRICGPRRGSPCPLASTSGSSAASRPTDSPAERQSGVKYAGGPCSSGRCAATAKIDSCLTVVTASPAIRRRSRSRYSEMCPAVWPGVGIHCQPGKPGTALLSLSRSNRFPMSIGPRG